MNTILHDTTVPAITLPTFHPSWCHVASHQAMLDEMEDSGPDDVRRHYASAGEGLLYGIHNSTDTIRDGDGSWSLALEQHPADETGLGGLPLIQLFTRAVGTGQACVLDITSGEARVLAAQLVAAADRLDLS